MAEHLTDEEWMELYRSLLGRLRELDHRGTIAEIEEAAARPVVVQPTPEEEARVTAISKDVGRTAIRTRTPGEAFAAAVSVLSARLVEMPAVAKSIQDRFEGHEVIFRPADEGAYVDASQAAFPLTAMIVSETDAMALRRELTVLEGAAVKAPSL